MMAELKEEYSDVLTPQLDLAPLYIPRNPGWTEADRTDKELFGNMYSPTSIQRREHQLKTITGWYERCPARAERLSKKEKNAEDFEKF